MEGIVFGVGIGGGAWFELMDMNIKSLEGLFPFTLRLQNYISAGSHSCP